MTAGGGAGVGVGGGVTSNGEEEEPRNLVRDLEAQRMKEVQYNREKNKPSSLQQLTMDINLEKRQAAAEQQALDERMRRLAEQLKR